MFERHPWRGGSEVWRKLGGVDKVAKKKGGKGVLYFSGCVLWRRKSQEMRYGYKKYARMSDLIFSSCECLLRNKPEKGVQYRQKYNGRKWCVFGYEHCTTNSLAECFRERK